jgi:hypothetical protein
MKGFRSHSFSWWHFFTPIILFALLIGACTPIPTLDNKPEENILPTATQEPVMDTPTPFEPLPPTPTDTPTPTPIPGVWVEPYIPVSIQQALTFPEGVSQAESPENSLVNLDVGTGDTVAEWIYALVTPFPTIPEGVTLLELKGRWHGESSATFGNQPLLMDSGTLAIFSALWGSPADGSVKVLPSEELTDAAWAERLSWAIVPFDMLEPRWKVLQVDGQSPLWKSFDRQNYPLTVHFGLSGDQSLIQDIKNASQQSAVLPLTNRDPQKLTTVILTGVTALVRATAETMRRNGITYPAKDVGPILREADIAHVSNEIPFAQNCPQPDPWQLDLRFCSRTEYVGLLEEIGTDVVELTGDHFADWGPDAMRYTLQMYKDRNWAYYGGGENVDDGRKALLIEHNGNKIAFIGCNAKGGGYATARKDNPGAVKCDWEFMSGEIKRLTAEGYNVITTFQHFEYYTYKAQPNQVKDSQAMADAGAVIVSGSQAHQPQGLEFFQGSFIHYGLGNLFFDQYHMGLPTSQGFLDRHVFYDGKYISTELIGIRFVDFARPRLMTPQEMKDLLTSVFTASGW